MPKFQPGLVLCLLLALTLAVIPPASAQSSSSTAAYVYIQVQGPAGPVYGFSSSSTGALSMIPGSPFKVTGKLIGGNGSQLFTLGQDLLHSYAVGSDGAIGIGTGMLSIYDFPGHQCGDPNAPTADAVLDHTGKYIYVLLQNGGTGQCAAYQTYSINVDGSFNFVGDVEENVQNQPPVSGGVDLPSILGSESFAYADEFSGHNNAVIGFQRQSNGTLQSLQFTETDPTLAGYSSNYTPYFPDASPAGNYVVLQLAPYDSGPSQLGSYTVDAKGNLATTNTSSNMPTSRFGNSSTIFSPAGNLLAVWGTGGQGQNGLDLYNFNGAAPLTFNKTLLSSMPVGQVAWDGSNHLYAMWTQWAAGGAQPQNTLYVFTVTPTLATQDSSWPLGSPYKMVVVSQTPTSGAGCAAPSGNGVNVCSPSEGSSLTSPLSINAAATISGGVYRFSLWNGGTKLVNVRNSGIMDQWLPLASGSYHLVFDAENSSGVHAYATRDITVSGATCAMPSSQGINVCTPSANATVGSTFSVQASALVTGGVWRFELWANGTKVYTVRENSDMNASISLPPGHYRLDFDARSTSGQHAYKTVYITTQ